MSETTTSQSHAAQHAAHEPPRRRHWLLAAGWPRAAWMTVSLLPARHGDRRRAPRARRLRSAARLAPRDRRRRADDGAARLPLRARRVRLLGLRTRSAARRGRRTTPSHGAYSWKDYFRVNTDHKVIGIQYLTTTFFFFLAGGLLALLVRAELARPGTQLRRHADVQRPVHRARVADDLPVHHPGVRRARELRRPADARRARHGVPAAQRALLLAAPDRRDHAARVVLRPGRRSRRLDELRAALRRRSRSATSSSRWGCSGPARRSIMTALNFLVTIITMRAPGMTFWRMPLLVWANFTTSLLVVIATPFIAGSQFFVMFDRVMHTNFFDPDEGGYVLGLPAHLLVLLAPGRLHHDAARVRDRLRGDLDLLAEADLRLPADGALADGDPRARLLGLGAPHVRVRDGGASCASR